MCYDHWVAWLDRYVSDPAWRLPRSAPLVGCRSRPRCNHHGSVASSSFLVRRAQFHRDHYSHWLSSTPKPVGEGRQRYRSKKCRADKKRRRGRLIYKLILCQRQPSIISASVFTQLSREATGPTTCHKEDRAAKMLGQRQQFKVAAFSPS
jgi:hypothetical protein